MAVLGFLNLFLGSWDITCGSVSDHRDLYSTVKPTDDPDGGYYVPFGNGPAPMYKRSVAKHVFLNLINQAEKYFYITTPYLIIDYDLTGALCNAALRGVEVRIITPGIADKKFIKIMTKSAYPKLMKAGVHIHEYTPGFIHEKTAVCDDKYAVIGTINLDYRSLVHHYEDGLWIYGSPIIGEAKAEFLSTLEKSREMDEKSAKLSFRDKLYKSLNRLFAPLL